MAATTPTGWRIVTNRWSARAEGIVTPPMRFASSANHARKSAAYATSFIEALSGLPCSRVISAASSLRRSRISVSALARTAARWYAVVPDQAGSARSAAAIAASVSARPPSAACPMTSPVAGSVTAKVAPPSAGRHCPST
jgi:hypothetical protein